MLREVTTRNTAARHTSMRFLFSSIENYEYNSYLGTRIKTFETHRFCVQILLHYAGRQRRATAPTVQAIAIALFVLVVTCAGLPTNEMLCYCIRTHRIPKQSKKLSKVTLCTSIDNTKSHKIRPLVMLARLMVAVEKTHSRMKCTSYEYRC